MTARSSARSRNEFRLTPIRPWPLWAVHILLFFAISLAFVATHGLGQGILGAAGLVEAGTIVKGLRDGRLIKPGDRQVMLQAVGSERGKVERVVSNYVGGTMDEARELVDRVPCALGRPVIASQAAIVLARLQQAGAVAIVNRATPPGEAGGGARLVLESAGVKKIQVIKVLRDLFGEGLAETKGWVDSSPCAVGYELSPASAAAAVEKLRAVGATVRIDVVPATAGPIATLASRWVPAWSSSADTCRLVLESTGEQKITVIKTLRQVFGAGLLDAKYWADNAPTLIEVDLSRPDGDAAIRALLAVGARASLVATPDRATD